MLLTLHGVGGVEVGGGMLTFLRRCTLGWTLRCAMLVTLHGVGGGWGGGGHVDVPVTLHMYVYFCACEYFFSAKQFSLLCEHCCLHDAFHVF